MKLELHLGKFQSIVLDFELSDLNYFFLGLITGVIIYSIARHLNLNLTNYKTK